MPKGGYKGNMCAFSISSTVVCEYESVVYLQVRKKEWQNFKSNAFLVLPPTNFSPQISEVMNLLSRQNRCRVSNSVDEFGDQ